MMRGHMGRIQSEIKEEKKDFTKIRIANIGIGFITALLCNGMLYFSVRQIFDNIYMKNQRKPLEADIPSYAAGFLMSFFIIMIILSVIKKREWVIMAAALISFVISLVNYYEYRFRGTVFTYEDFNNAGTAVRVLGQYDIKPTTDVYVMLLFFFLLIVISVLCHQHERRYGSNIIDIRLFAGWMLLMLFFFTSYFLVEFVMNKKDPWSWEELYAREGYVTGTTHFVLENLHSPVQKPAGYDEWKEQADIPEITEPAAGESEDLPDIVLILNETWYDFGHYIALDTDTDYMSHYKKLDADKGYCVVPISGGGTNNSEYELLTSNSMTLMNTYAPFLSLKPDEKTAITGYLKKIGYYTLAAHSEQGTNYKRNQVWPALGFDQTHFGEDFTGLEYYGKRERATDRSVFRNVQRFYENMPKDTPRFVFWLTIQNHGGWNINPSEDDTVHLKENIKPESMNNRTEIEKQTGTTDLEGVLNEYLSCVSHTDAFIDDLTDYFSEVYRNEGRKVIICMVGDHAPDFINWLNPPAGLSKEGNLQNREVPYFIWKNYEKMNKGEEKVFDLCCLTPFVLKEAGLPLTPYYQRLCELGNETRCFTKVPVLRDGLYFMDQKGSVQSVSDKSELSEKIKEYFYMEYGRIERIVSRNGSSGVFFDHKLQESPL